MMWRSAPRMRCRRCRASSWRYSCCSRGSLRCRWSLRGTCAHFSFERPPIDEISSYSAPASSRLHVCRFSCPQRPAGARAPGEHALMSPIRAHNVAVDEVVILISPMWRLYPLLGRCGAACFRVSRLKMGYTHPQSVPCERTPRSLLPLYPSCNSLEGHWLSVSLLCWNDITHGHNLFKWIGPRRPCGRGCSCLPYCRHVACGQFSSPAAGPAR